MREKLPGASKVWRSKSTTSVRFWSLRYAPMALMRFCLRSSCVAKSVTRSGRRRRASANSVRALSHFEKWLRSRVVRDRGRGDLDEPLGELLHVPRPSDLRPVGQAEDEVAEAEVLDHETPQVVEEDRRALQEERGPGRDREGLVFLAEGLQHDGHVAHLSPHGPGKVEPGLAGPSAVARELDVRDDAEDLLAVLSNASRASS